LENTDDDGKFHLKRVEVVEFVWGSEPFRIEAEGIYTTLFFSGILFDLGIFIATSKYIQGDGEEFVIDPACIEWEKSHHEQQIPDFPDVWE
jgi:hypothetical protein